MLLQNKIYTEGRAKAGACEINSSYERDRFNETIDAIFIACKTLLTSKNADYTALNPSDPFFNFRQGSVDKFLKNENINKIDGLSFGINVRLNDKRRRRENLMFTGEREVYTETLEDTILDEINYLAILLTHLKMHGFNKDHQVKEVEQTPRDSKLDYVIEENMRLSKQYSQIAEHNDKLINENQELKKKNGKRSK